MKSKDLSNEWDRPFKKLTETQRKVLCKYACKVNPEHVDCWQKDIKACSAWLDVPPLTRFMILRKSKRINRRKNKNDSKQK